MTETQLYDEAFAQMSAAPPEPGENVGPRRGRRAGAGYGTKAGGRPRKPKTLLIDGVLQDGLYALVSVTSETIVVESK